VNAYLSIQQTIETSCGVGQRNVVDAVFDLPSVSVVLTLDTGGLIATFGRPSLVDAADRFGTRMLGGNDLLATIPQLLFVPNDRFQKPLERSWGDILIKCDRFGILPLHVRK